MCFVFDKTLITNLIMNDSKQYLRGNICIVYQALHYLYLSEEILFGSLNLMCLLATIFLGEIFKSLWCISKKIWLYWSAVELVATHEALATMKTKSIESMPLSLTDTRVQH